MVPTTGEQAIDTALEVLQMARETDSRPSWGWFLYTRTRPGTSRQVVARHRFPLGVGGNCRMSFPFSSSLTRPLLSFQLALLSCLHFDRTDYLM